MKRIITAGVAGGALAIALAVGTLNAAPASSTQQAAVAQQQPTPAPTTPTTPDSQAPGKGRGGRGGFHGGFGFRGFGFGSGSLFTAATTVTGLTAEELRTELASEKSLAQIAQANGKTANDIISTARTSLQTALTQAVTDGRITQAQADRQLKRFDLYAPVIVQDTTLGVDDGPRGTKAPKTTQPAPTSGTGA